MFLLCCYSRTLQFILRNLQYVPPQPATPQERRAVQKVLIFKLPPQSLTIRHWKIVVGRLLSNNWGPVTFQGRAVKLPEGKPLFERSGPRFRVGAGDFSRISGSSLDAGCNSCRSQRAELWVEMELWVEIAHIQCEFEFFMMMIIINNINESSSTTTPL